MNTAADWKRKFEDESKRHLATIHESEEGLRVLNGIVKDVADRLGVHQMYPEALSTAVDELKARAEKSEAELTDERTAYDERRKHLDELTTELAEMKARAERAEGRVDELNVEVECFRAGVYHPDPALREALSDFVDAAERDDTDGVDARIERGRNALATGPGRASSRGRCSRRS